LAVIATDISSGDRVVIDHGPVAQAVMASTCIPGIFKPVKIDGRYLVDGGIVENIPIKTTRKLGAKYVIGVDLNGKHSYQKPNNLLDVIINSFHFLMQHAEKFQAEKADLLIQPDLSGFNRSDTGQVEQLIQRGYEDSKKALTATMDTDS
ncbi:MAG: patatin-like phospholipase family protein, partial [Flavobacteriaceae bacterium]|nr:patatin-like phospholipase family protein [Flavobacteriaceae bacterium]